MAIGRLNPDTTLDFAVACKAGGPGGETGGCVAVFRGWGDGTFFPTGHYFAVNPGATPAPEFIKIADFDRDGYNDIVTSNVGTDNLSVLLNAFDVQGT